ncbi:MAG TPA: hypothetical protein VFA15_00050, partial [Nitrososphaera sp.]|nr:hypothetical protein [Nitrososphaera sp.]
MLVKTPFPRRDAGFRRLQMWTFRKECKVPLSAKADYWQGMMRLFTLVFAACSSLQPVPCFFPPQRNAHTHSPGFLSFPAMTIWCGVVALHTSILHQNWKTLSKVHSLERYASGFLPTKWIPLKNSLWKGRNGATD